jgi:hypothetical protein
MESQNYQGDDDFNWTNDGKLLIADARSNWATAPII